MVDVNPPGGIQPVKGTGSSSKTMVLDLSKPADVLMLGIIFGNADPETAKKIEAGVDKVRISGGTKVKVPTLEVVTNRRFDAEVRQTHQKLLRSVNEMLRN